MRDLRLSTAAVLSPVVVLVSVFAFSAQAQVSVDPMVARLQSRMDTIEQNIQRATGRVEESGFQTNQLQKRIEFQAEEISILKQALAAQNERVKKLEAIINAPLDAAANAADGPAETTVPLVGATDSTTKASLAAARTDEAIASKPADIEDLPEDPSKLFRQAKNLLLKGDYPAAETAFAHLVSTHPDVPEAAEAQYWLGESLLIQEAFPEAAEAYVALIRNYPDAPKAPDSLVKLARSLRMMGDTTQACGALTELSNLYPQTNPMTRSLAKTERDRAGCDS
ncbi:tol-pal system protein YbgF [Hirschia baltica]|nr:tol-pal system protein YbgF [Hirschia baltica]